MTKPLRDERTPTIACPRAFSRGDRMVACQEDGLGVPRAKRHRLVTPEP